jgi:hypothetical protein
LPAIEFPPLAGAKSFDERVFFALVEDRPSPKRFCPNRFSAVNREAAHTN